MPVHVVKGRGSKPYKIKDISGRVVGTSKTKGMAQRSANVRNAIYYSGGAWKPTRNR